MEVLKADLALRAVVVPEGKHVVEFTMVPVSFYWGAGLTLATLLSVGAAELRSRRRRAVSGRPG
ncbi:MAG: hypothetical protein HYR98_00600 [Nitrospirae bacterium]|nr:hypothetical protein [Nitrospirota bacterium]